jgi:hypothetical protein
MAGSNHQVRYYSPAFDKHVSEAIPSLLEELWNRHRIANEVIPVRLVPSFLNGAKGPDEAHEKELYDRDFWPRWRVLNARTGTRISKVLRSNSGNHFVAGVVAICSTEGLEWFAAPSDRFSTYDQVPTRLP